MMFESLEEEGHMGVPNPFPGDFSLLLPALGVMLPAVGAAALAGGCGGDRGWMWVGFCGGWEGRHV